MAANSKARLRNEAERLMIQGKIPQAIDQYLKIVQKDPEDIMTLNTIGDLYLTIGYTEKANHCFTRVAENYVRNNFFLKAVAVYKKILRDDPFNLQINGNIASLYARQGMNTEACKQYLSLIKIYEQTGNNGEIVDTYRKIVELDPGNTAVQQKLADVFLAKEEKGQAREHLLSAARGLVKKEDYIEAMDCFGKAIQIDPLDIVGLEGFMECCLKTGNIPDILRQLSESLKLDPRNLHIKEMLGQVHLANNDPETAYDILQAVVSSDESRYECLIPVGQAFINLRNFDKASECLDPIIPILITRRRTGLAVKHYQDILNRCTWHMPTLGKLASVYSAAGEMSSYLGVLDKIADRYIDQQDPAAALEYLEKILQVDPESKKHLDLHKVAFIDAYPDKTYVAPIAQTQEASEALPAYKPQEYAEANVGPSENLVEADLLINYGMKEKALSLLQNLETRDPNDKDVRTRLLMLLREGNKFTEAAEQCLLLAVLYGKSNDEDAAEKYLAEAKKLDEELVDREHDLETFARKRGIVTEKLSGSSSLKADPEVDLSGDLLDIFFTDDQSRIPEDTPDIPTIPNEIPQVLPSPTPTQTMEEKLQEVDFYIRLGFKEEASIKLNEIAKISPDNPELPSRYKKLEEMEAAEDQEPQEPVSPEDQSAEEILEDASVECAEDDDIFQDIDIDEALENFTENSAQTDDSSAAEFAALPETRREDGTELPQSLPDDVPLNETSGFGLPEHLDDKVGDKDSESIDILGESEPEEKVSQAQFPEEDASVSEQSDFVANDMFSDLLEEVSTLNEQEIAHENFEDHFSLGTAYRDMDLVEEAIKEFQTAFRITESTKDTRKLIQCCGMLSMCFLKKNMPRSALRWCQTGLSAQDITSQEAMALRYDMGIAHSKEGNRELALKCFDQIFSSDPGYRDVAQKIDEIKSSRI